MAPPIQLLYFGDQSIQPLNSLEDLLRETRTSNTLPQFLCSAFGALQNAVSALSPTDRSLFIGRDFGQVVQHVRAAGIRHAAVSSVLSCVTQLGWAILHRERNPDLWGEHGSRVIAGSCTGTLPAIAAAAALSDTDLLRLAPVFVQLSLRLGLEVSHRGFFVEASHESWSVAISGISTEIVRWELKRFNESRHVPSHKRVYMSAYLASSMTLSGPPSFLQEFLSSEPMRLSRKLSIPIYGPFHASHLPLPDLDAIIGHSDLFQRSVKGYGSLLHPRLQDDSDVPSLRNLLLRAVHDILQKPLAIDDDIQQILKRTQGCEVHLITIGPARVSHLERALNPAEIYRLGSRRLSSNSSPNNFPDYEESIAVVGMAGRFPDAQNVDELWRILIEGRDVHRMIPIDRFDVRTHVDPTGKVKNTSLTPYGCFDDHVSEFDISLFKMSPREAAQTDPMQRMMLLTAYEALESAGYYDNGDEDFRPKNGTFYGVAGDDYRQVNSGQSVDTNYITGGTRAFGPGRVSYYFGWEGPSMSVDTACSASGVAIHQAIASLKLKECDVALAGGANLLTCSDMFAGLSRAKFVCSTGPCKTFDETADGYCRADATATVVFKRFGDAIRDKDNILGVIRSIETNHAGTAISLTHPEADTQAALFNSVLKSAGLGVNDIDHIELHGTGTQAGDLAESSSVVELLKEQPRNRPLTISSIKPNVGHSEAASGVTSLIKGLLMLQHQTIPPHVGIKTRFNPKLPPLGNFNILIPRENMAYPARDGSTRRMLVNNFNASGGITAMLLEEYRSSPVVANDIRQHYPITLSAASMTALSCSQTRLLEHCKANASIELSHLSYTLTSRRLHHKHRFACVVSSIEELIQKLQTGISASRRGSKQVKSAFGVFVFTGQASTYSGMAKTLYETNEPFRNHLLRSDAICRDMKLPSFLEIVTNDKADISSFSQTQNQLALVALEIALASLLETWGIRPKAVIGHSLGEYSALCFSQVLSLADTLYLVGNRGVLLESVCKRDECLMAAVSLPAQEVEKTLRLPNFSEHEIACLNAPDQTVVSGPCTDIESLMAQFSTKNVRVTKLPMPFAFHSKQMDAILSKYRQIAERIPFKKPSVPLASTLLADLVLAEGVLNSEYLCRQTREPVRFQDALHKVKSLLEDGQSSLWMEIGPGPACLPMIASAIRAKSNNLACALDPTKPNWLTLSNLVTKYYNNNGNVRWDEYHKEYLSSLGLLALPSYPFDLKKYWIQYEGDWVIRKNQPASIQPQAARPTEPRLESSTLQRLENVSVDKGTRKLVFSSQLSLGELQDIREHYRINRQPAYPSSVYVDMALAATSYLHKSSANSSKSPAMEVTEFELCFDLDLLKAQSMKLIAIQRPSDTNIVEVSINSPNHGDSIELVRCKVIIDDIETWAADANSNAYLYQSRVDLLNLFLANGQTWKLSQSEAYQYLSGFIDCEKSFHGIQEVLLNSGALEATAKIKLPPSKERHVCDLRWLDTFVQVPTLIVNCGHGHKRGTRSTCRGWNKMHVLLPLEPDIIYQVHVRMHPQGQTGSMTGDVHVLTQAGKAAAVIKQIQFKPVPGSKLDAAPSLPSNIAQFQPPSPAADSGYASDSQLPKSPEVSGTFDSRHQQPKFCKATVNDNPTPVMALPKPVATDEALSSVSNGVSINKHSDKPSQSNGSVHGSVPSEPPPPMTPKPQPRSNEKVEPTVSGGSGSGSVDFSEILAVMAEEIGVEPGSLTDDVLLDDLGVDSIIQISLVASIQELLPDPLPAGLLLEHDSIAKLRRFFTDTAGK